MPFPRLLVKIENMLWPTQRMHHRIPGKIFYRIIWPIITPPPWNTLEIPPDVEIAVIKNLARRGLRAHQFPLQKCPLRRGNR